MGGREEDLYFNDYITVLIFYSVHHDGDDMKDTQNIIDACSMCKTNLLRRILGKKHIRRASNKWGRVPQ